MWLNPQEIRWNLRDDLDVIYMDFASVCLFPVSIIYIIT